MNSWKILMNFSETPERCLCGLSTTTCLLFCCWIQYWRPFFYQHPNWNRLLQVSVGEAYSLACQDTWFIFRFAGHNWNLFPGLFWVVLMSCKLHVSSPPLKQAFLFDQLFTAPSFHLTERSNHHKSGRALGMVFNPFGCVQLSKWRLLFPFMLSCENTSKSICFLSQLQCCFPQTTKGLILVRRQP